jgi:hypothetical protein
LTLLNVSNVFPDFETRRFWSCFHDPNARVNAYTDADANDVSDELERELWKVQPRPVYVKLVQALVRRHVSLHWFHEDKANTPPTRSPTIPDLS